MSAMHPCPKGSADALGPIATLPSKDGQTGTGIYLLSGCMEQVGHSKQPRLQLTLEDATGRATGFVWPEARSATTCPTTPSPVSVQATVQIFEGKPQLKLHSVAPAQPRDVTYATGLLSRRRCPDIARPALERLVRLEESLPAPLDGFLREVLLDPLLGLPFLRCRASVRHHHAYIGGLLVHSTDMLDLASEIIQRIIPDDAWSPYLAQLAYLLHDIGKLKSVGELRRPMYALVVSHEVMAIELLAPHLRWLEERAAPLAVALRYVFAHMATPFRARPMPNHVIAEVVTTLDQWSAATHNRRDLTHLLHGNRWNHASELRSLDQRSRAVTEQARLLERQHHVHA